MSIQEHLNKIRNAIKGSEVRESIAKGIETAYDDASEKHDNANMEVKIARGTHPNLRSRLEEVDNKQQQTTAQLAQKANETDVRKKSVKIELEDMSEETLGAMSGNATFDLLSIPQDNSVTKEKIVNGEVTLNKTTVDIFPRNIDEWSVVNYNLTVGSESTYTSNSYRMNGRKSRFDTSILIKVVAGSTLNFTGATASTYQVAVWEYDANKLGIKDSGYQTTSLTLSPTTEYVRLLCSTKDYTTVSLEEMINNSNITIEMPLNDYSKVLEYSPINKRVEKIKENRNLISVRMDFWESGSYKISASNPIPWDDESRIRLKQEFSIGGFEQKRKFYYSVPSGYKLGIIALKNDGTYLKDLGFQTGSGYIYTIDGISKVLLVLAFVDDSPISTYSLNGLEIVLSFEEIEYKVSEKDNEKAVKDVAFLSNAISTSMRLSDKIRYIGHSGTGTYAPENTIESYKMASIMGMWGAETDLGITSDGYLVLMHDYTLDRTTDGTGNVSDYTLAEIQAMNIDFNLRGFSNVKVPTIEEYLDTCKKYGLYPVIEVKENGHTTGMVDALLPILDRYNITKDCMLISFGEETLTYIRSKNPYINLGYLLKKGELITDLFINFVKSLGNCAIDVYGSTSLTREMIEKCHKEEIPVIAWTIDNRVLCDYLESIGVDMITTNKLIDPNRNRKVIDATFSTSDNGTTWTNTEPLLKNSVTVNNVDEYIIEITFDGYLKQAIANLAPVAKVQNITNSPVIIEMNCYRNINGNIGVRFFQAGVQKKISELPSYMHLHCEVTF